MKVALIGRVAEGKKLYDGQTIKTRNLYRLLQEIKDIESVTLVDTYQYKKHIFGVLFRTIASLRKCDKIVLSISINGRKFFFPFLYYLNKLFHKEIYHSLIGGRLGKNIEQYPKWKKYISSFSSNWVEAKVLVIDLAKHGVVNAEYVPNFKYIELVKEDDSYSDDDGIVKFCTFSRVQEKKGIKDAIIAIANVNSANKKKIAHLDVYGPIDEDYKKEFNDLCVIYQDYVRYCGSVEASKSVDTLKGYNALIFATQYYNEGIPGTIIDALAAGIPVIARKWHYCDEMLLNNENAYVYDFDCPEELEKILNYVIENKKELIKMKEKCLLKAREYMPENAKGIICRSMNLSE